MVTRQFIRVCTVSKVKVIFRGIKTSYSNLESPTCDPLKYILDSFTLIVSFSMRKSQEKNYALNDFNICVFCLTLQLLNKTFLLKNTNEKVY